MKSKLMLVGLLAACGLATASSAATIAPVGATIGGCYESGCNGLDPAGRCDGDAFTVAYSNVHNGVLELRYSPSCRANWGRYTPHKQDAVSFLAMGGRGIWARVTVWNPNDASYGTAHHANDVFGMSWSTMTNGRYKACTGVEVVITVPGDDNQSQGWDRGSCY